MHFYRWTCIVWERKAARGEPRKKKKNIYTWIWCLFNRIINGQLQEEEEEEEEKRAFEVILAKYTKI